LALALAVVPVRAGEDEHAHHHAAKPSHGVNRSEANYVIPGVSMVRQDGTKATFPTELDDGRPVILTFIYTTCTTICPVLSHVLAQAQKKLDRERVHIVSISIDPERDTPARLLEYAKRFDAGPQWQHYTGTAQASVALQKGFDAYRGDKMNHTPVTYLRGAPGQRWVRLEGFSSDDDVVAEYKRLTAQDQKQ
jgi:protein SCO1/2